MSIKNLSHKCAQRLSLVQFNHFCLQKLSCSPVARILYSELLKLTCLVRSQHQLMMKVDSAVGH